jgi:CelD/BcsL family acetyltransferase involved in cellulose biosynthesis
MLNGPHPECLFEDLREDWSRLAGAGDNVFATWEWARTWWKHFGGGRPLLPRLCVSENGAAIAVLPLYLARRRPLRVMRLVGHGPADELGPVGRREDAVAAARHLKHALEDVPCDLFLADQLPGGVDWPGVLGGAVLRRESSPVLRAPEGWEEFLSTRSANFRQQVAGRERRLQREHRLFFRLVDDPARLQQDLDTLFALHRALRPRSDFGPEAFHREFAATALERGWLRFWILELDGLPAAAWYGFRFRGVESYYQAGRDPAADRLSVGSVLLVHTMRAAFDDGVREYRLGRGAENYKYRFASDDPGVVTVVAPNGPLGATAVMAARATRQLARHLKRR